MTNAQLRQELQRRQKRQRLALTSLEAMQRAVRDLQLPSEQAGLVLSHVRSVPLVLQGEVLS